MLCQPCIHIPVYQLHAQSHVMLFSSVVVAIIFMYKRQVSLGPSLIDSVQKRALYQNIYFAA